MTSKEASFCLIGVKRLGRRGKLYRIPKKCIVQAVISGMTHNLYCVSNTKSAIHYAGGMHWVCIRVSRPIILQGGVKVLVVRARAISIRVQA